MKIRAIFWDVFTPMLAQAARKLNWLDLKVFAAQSLNDKPERCKEALEELKTADLILVYRSVDPCWEIIETEILELGKRIPFICVSFDPTYWPQSSVKLQVVDTCYRYLMLGGEENFEQLFCYLAHEVGQAEIQFRPPRELPWEGLYHPEAPQPYYVNPDEYLEWYEGYCSRTGLEQAPLVALLFSRFYWVNKNLDVENPLILELERQGLRTLPIFSFSVQDANIGAKGMGQALQDLLFQASKPFQVQALVKLIPFLLSTNQRDQVIDQQVTSSGVELLRRLDVPVFQPIIAYSKTEEEWRQDLQGTGSELSWSVAMPEFEGVVEPIIIGAVKKGEDVTTSANYRQRVLIQERCRHLVSRIKQWIELRQKPVAARKAAFILHNSPCASVEATVGAAAYLDSLESVTRVMRQMQELGYQILPPASGEELLETIMEKKAISEFRWTTVAEIVQRGGALAQVELDDYLEWWAAFPPGVREKISAAWGEPPGEEINGVPAAMVYDRRILVTGVDCGSAVVCVQPKRGCAGPKCDGRVCKILHDPEIPPPHQYLATYRWLEKTFAADFIIHVGTHGSLEFLPGKGIALSESCLPDLAINHLPHLYIYNAAVSTEGMVAKRRSYATLIDHLQPVFSQGGLYDELEELNRYLDEYEQARIGDQGRAHTLEQMVLEQLHKTNLDQEIGRLEEMPFIDIKRRAHEILSRIRNTQVQDGMHIFGELPAGPGRLDFLNAILRYDAGEEYSLRKIISRAMGLDFQLLLQRQGDIDERYRRSHGELLAEIDLLGKEVIRELLLATDADWPEKVREVMVGRIVAAEHLSDLAAVRRKLADLNHRLESSREIEALLRGAGGGYIPPGPSGLITRGRDDVLPTGRNFFSLDPQRVPTKAAYEVGKRMAKSLVDKHLREEGAFPENIGIFWMCTDIMWSDGEVMGQIMDLLGVKPEWRSNGRVKGFKVIPLEELGRPRIDVTLRVSGITRDHFPICIDLIDEAIQAAAGQDESPEKNFVRKHSLAKLEALKADISEETAWRQATLRIFSSKPGTYMPGVNLAIYASAWQDDKDLAEIFVFWNGYAYGKGVYGQESYDQFISSLKTVDATFNKVLTDEADLLGCCCYFGAHGGMTAAVRNIAGKDAKNYYGDSREPENVEVRDLADEIRRVVRARLLNPKWIEGMKRHGYKGAGDIAGAVGRVYGWEATTREVDDWIFDDIVRTFMMNKENREFFEKYNPWAMEEIGRRLMEAESRGLWQADPEILQHLKDYYLEVEGWLEDRMESGDGDFQGGAVNILTTEDVADWGQMLREVREKLKKTAINTPEISPKRINSQP
ncbi:MAG: cobaltochelatase subunit CobN [Thermodesulfobacteriota bacterium]